MYRRIGKRLLDVILATVLITIFFPVMVVVAITVLIAMGSPILFRQRRPGLHGQPYTMLKFRTMREGRDFLGYPLSDGIRITKLGRFLRSTSLDELPELLNVISGKMSLVGPRPLLMRYLDLYSTEQQRRHNVLPGITGWAQVNGRNSVSWAERFKLDIWYVDHVSLKVDLRILFLTVIHVLKRQGIHAEGEATMAEFRGNH